MVLHHENSQVGLVSDVSASGQYFLSSAPLALADRRHNKIASILWTAVFGVPTCSGESVFVSRAAAAESIRAEVARQVSAGLRTDEQILSYIEQRFGGECCWCRGRLVLMPLFGLTGSRACLFNLLALFGIH